MRAHRLAVALTYAQRVERLRVRVCKRSAAALSVRLTACFACRDYLQLTRKNPSAVHESGDHSQKNCANHCNQRCEDRSTISTDAYEAHCESAYYGSTNTHEDVHKWTIAITLENSSGSPAYDCPGDNPCK
jgi:hypothetical protein